MDLNDLINRAVRAKKPNKPGTMKLIEDLWRRDEGAFSYTQTALLAEIYAHFLPSKPRVGTLGAWLWKAIGKSSLDGQLVHIHYADGRLFATGGARLHCATNLGALNHGLQRDTHYTKNLMPIKCHPHFRAPPPHDKFLNPPHAKTIDFYAMLSHATCMRHHTLHVICYKTACGTYQKRYIDDAIAGLGDAYSAQTTDNYLILKSAPSNGPTCTAYIGKVRE